MSTITIKDLTESIDLDRKAMLAIVGGARRSGFLSPLENRALHSTRLVDYPAGFGRTHLAMTRARK